MTRNYAHYGLRGATDDARDDAHIPGWMQKVWHSRGLDGFANPISLDDWGTNAATRHDLINVAVGSGDETDAFSLAEDNRAVVDADTHEVYNIVSTRYELIPNETVATALRDVLCDFNLQGDVFGEARDYGNFVNLDLYFNSDATQFTNPDTDDVMAFGVEVRAAHDTSTGVRGRLITRDGYCRNTLRGISQDGWRGIRHYKPASDHEAATTYEEMYDLFAALILELCGHADAFVTDTERALDTAVDFSAESFSVREFYETWLPENLATQTVLDAATQRAAYRANLIDDTDDEYDADTVTLSAWALISGFTYAVSHASNVSDGQRKDRYHRTARDALSAPERLIQHIRTTYAIEDDTVEDSDTDADADAGTEVFEKGATAKREIESLAD